MDQATVEPPSRAYYVLYSRLRITEGMGRSMSHLHDRTDNFNNEISILQIWFSYKDYIRMAKYNPLIFYCYYDVNEISHIITVGA